ncbi:MAG: DUF1998 domain-containing protein [bacterium]
MRHGSVCGVQEDVQNRRKHRPWRAQLRLSSIFHTTAYWLENPSDNFPDLSCDPERWARIVAGLGEVLKTAASLKLMCDPRDLQLTIGSLAEDRWLSAGFDGLTLRDRDGTSHGFEASPDTPPGQIGPVLYDPTVFIYDRFPGGVGFGEGLFEDQRAFMRLSLDLLQKCGCEHGCPSCVGPPEPGRSDIKSGVISLISRLAFVN